MKHRRITALLLVLALVAGLTAGCHTDPKPAGTDQPSSAGQTEPSVQTTVPTTEPPAPDPGAEYLAALEALKAGTALTAVSELSTAYTVGSVTVTEDQQETVRSQDRGSEALTVSVNRKVQFDRNTSGRSAVLTQLYHNGELFTEVSDSRETSVSRFWAPETRENFLGQLTPLELLDPANYGQVLQEEDRIRFSEPQAPEGWAMPEGAQFETAEGWAELQDGVLLRQGYEISYTLAGASIRFTCSSTLTAGVDEDLTALIPAGKDGCTELQSTEAILALLRAQMAVTHADIMELRQEKTIYSQASGEILQSRDRIHMYGTGKDMLYQEKLEYSYMDVQGKSTEAASYTGRMDEAGYLWQEDGEEAEPEPLTSRQRVQLASNVIFAMISRATLCIPNPSHLTDATVYDLGDYYLVEYSCGEAFSKQMDADACYDFYNDENKLADLASAYRPDTMEGYVAVEKITWIPTAAGVTYVAAYVINGTPYRIAMQQDVGIGLYDPGTYKEITDKPLPDTEPEQKPNPVFYEVTGENGEKLYLFGTIHVGDDRTGFLPQAIYDAFDQADALAVEFDDAAFEQQINEDPDLLQRVAGAYYYLDGTSIKDHLEEELYHTAVRFCKLTGNYTDTAEKMKPFVWSNALENFYLDQGRRLTSSKGVDHRLMDRAREQEKEILNVESGISQLEMMANYSDKLQELMLKETMGMPRAAYLDGVYELYDLWCRGDEAALIEKITKSDEQDLAEMSEEEKALYEEYHAAMETDRNEKMLETAKGYLASGKTVFFAVGLAHLLGDNGLVGALRDAGYTVTLIQES